MAWLSKAPPVRTEFWSYTQKGECYSCGGYGLELNRKQNCFQCFLKPKEKQVEVDWQKWEKDHPWTWFDEIKYQFKAFLKSIRVGGE